MITLVENETYTFIVPCYNEEEIISANFLKIGKALSDIREDMKLPFGAIKLVCLNDGSTDNTETEILDDVFRYQQYHLLDDLELIYIKMNGPSRRENLLKYIATKVNTTYVGYMDCDIATDLKDLKLLLGVAPYYDIVSGSRYLVSSKVKRDFSRRMISYLFNNGIRILFGSKIRDHECGFKIFKTDKLKTIIKYTKYGDKYKDRKMLWDSEMWVYAQQLNYKVLEIPVEWEAGKKSALRFTSETRMIKYVLKLWWSKRWQLNKK